MSQSPSLLKNKHNDQTGRCEKSTQLSARCKKKSYYFRGDACVCQLFFISIDIKPNIIKGLMTRFFPTAYCWEAALFRGCDL